MKTKNGNRGKAKRAKENSKQTTCSNCKHRAQSVPPSSILPAPPSPKREKHTRGERSTQQSDLHSLIPACVHDNPTSHREEGRRPSYHYECPVEVQSQKTLSARERHTVLREMEAEFENTKKVVISGLPPESNEENLEMFFSELSCIPVTKVKDGSVRVIFPSHQAANRSISILNSTILSCHQLSASYGHPDSLLFIGNLPFTYARDDLAKLLAAYGVLLRCLVVYSPETGLSKGYGFVEYQTREEAAVAKQVMANKVVGLRSLRVDFADNGMQKCKDLQSETLFVDRLPKNFHDEEMLKKRFSNYGSVHFCQVALTPSTGAPRGFAFIDMSSPEEAERAQLANNGTPFAGQQMRVSFGMPCRHGACILHHKSNPPSMPHPHTLTAQYQAPPLCCSTFLKENYPLQWGGHNVLIQGRRASEGCVLAQHIKPRPLMNITNSKSDTCLITQRRGSLPRVPESAHFFQHCCMHGYSLSMPALCPHLCRVTTKEDQMEEEVEGGADSTHNQAKDMMPLQDRASVATFVKQHFLPPPTTSTYPTAPPSPPLPVPANSFVPITAPPSPPLPVFLPDPPQLCSTMLQEAKSPVPMPEWEGPEPGSGEREGDREEGEEESPMPQEMAQSPPPSPARTLPLFKMDRHLDLQLVDSVLGKRQILDYHTTTTTATQDMWGCGDGGVLGVWPWGCGKGAYDQPYIGQHQQGIPYTHPLKRIRMEQY